MNVLAVLKKLDEIDKSNSSVYLYEGLSTSNKKSVFLWESAGKKLIEANLTTDQINQLFADVEKAATDSGSNRTLIGKGKDAASAVNQAWEDLKTKVQNSGPIKNVDALYDQAAEKLKQATGGDQGVMTYVQKYRDFAQKHPIAQSLIYSALIAAAGISGAGLGGAAALGLFKMVDKLLQGEKFSSAAYQGAKTGAMAYAAGQIGKAMKGSPEPEVPANTPGASLKVGQELPDGEVVTGLNSSDPNAGVTITRPDGSTYSVSREYAHSLSGQQGISPTGPVSGSYTSDVDAGVRDAPIRRGNSGWDQKPSQPTITGADGSSRLMTPQEIAAAKDAARASLRVKESVNLTPNQINLIFEHVSDSIILEGIWDSLKGAVGKAANWAQTKGANLTNKVTADKLQQAWKAAGSPTDSEEVKKVLQSSGVDAGIIDQAYTKIGIQSNSTASDPASTDTKQPATPQDNEQPASTPTAEKPTSTPQPSNSQSSSPMIDSIKTAYSKLDPADRKKLRDELEIIDDQERLASGTNESLSKLITLIK